MRLKRLHGTLEKTQRATHQGLWMFCVLILAMGAPSSYAFDVFGWFKSDSDDTTETVIALSEPLPIDQPHDVFDLAYGDVLFDFYQEQYFSAITKVLVAQERGQLTYNSEHAELVLGALYVSYGMLDKGESIFNRLLNEYSTQSAADESWYQLARIFYKRGDTAKALAMLTMNIVEPVESRETEHLLLQVLCHIRLGQLDEARAISGYLQAGKPLSIFIRFNLGAAFAQLGDLEQAAGYYREVVLEPNKNTEADKTLNDQSALALGIYYLRNNKLLEAEQELNKIRLYGPVATQALLAMGWAKFSNDQKLDALTPWTELSERPLTDPAVQESLLNIPYVYESLGALQDALDGYKRAYKIYRDQRRKLFTIKEEINKPDWIETISPIDLTGQDAMTSLPTFKLPQNSDVTRHLYVYFASNDFQRLYRDYRELQRLYMVLNQWERQFPSYNQMIENHVSRLNDLVPRSEKAIQQSQQFYAYSRVKLEEFETKLAQIIADDDLSGFATVSQLAQKERLDAMEQTLNELNDPDAYAEEWAKLKLLKGLLLWDLNALSIEKRWQASKDNVAIENLLIELENRIRSLTQARESRMDRFYDFETRLIALQARVNTLKSETAQLLRTQRNLMQNTATGIIENQQRHLDQMRAKALLSIARLQDLAYMQERNRKQIREQSFTIELGEPDKATESVPSIEIEDTSKEQDNNEPYKGPSRNLGDVIRRIFSDDE